MFPSQKRLFFSFLLHGLWLAIFLFYTQQLQVIYLIRLEFFCFKSHLLLGEKHLLVYTWYLSYLVNVSAGPSISFITFRTRPTCWLTNPDVKTAHARKTGAVWQTWTWRIMREIANLKFCHCCAFTFDSWSGVTSGGQWDNVTRDMSRNARYWNSSSS